MRKKTTKPFGIWVDPRYVAKVDDNDKVYRKIRERLRYFENIKQRKTVSEVIELMHRNPFWHTRLLSQSDRSWESHLTRRNHHRCKRKIRP